MELFNDRMFSVQKNVLYDSCMVESIVIGTSNAGLEDGRWAMTVETPSPLALELLKVGRKLED